MCLLFGRVGVCVCDVGGMDVVAGVGVGCVGCGVACVAVGVIVNHTNNNNRNNINHGSVFDVHI